MYMVRPSGVIARLKVPRFVPLQETGPLMRPASRIVRSALATTQVASPVTGASAVTAGFCVHRDIEALAGGEAGLE
jgi:hypothetical protein